MIKSITPFLWFDDQAEDAARFYASIFPGSSIESTSPMSTTFVLAGQRFIALNGGPLFTFTPAVSFFVSVETQEEVDRLWDALLAGGGEPSKCGWLEDKYGLSWQIVPTALGEMLNDDNDAKSDAVMQAMLQMVKLDIAGLRRAYDAAT
jgi:predicted 3-demethylubiquinone-9 3-methyltransferase (glyoxalase superfamily)